MRFLTGSLLFLFALAPVPAAAATATCTFTAASVLVNAEEAIEPVTIIRSGDEILVYEGDTLVPCGVPGPTTETAGRVAVEGGTVLVLDLSGGPFTGSGGDLDLDVDLGSGTIDRLVVIGSAGAEHVVVGIRSIDLNRGPASADDDVLLTAVERIQIETGDGDDEVDARGSTVPMIIDGGAGNDDLVGAGRPDVLAGGPGDDTLDAAGGPDALSGGEGADVLTGGTGDDYLVGGPGDDREEGGDGDDILDQGPAPDGADIVSGGDGKDTAAYDRRTGGVVLAPGDLFLDGQADEGDLLLGDLEALLGGDGDDTLTGSIGPDALFGGAGDDTISAGEGDDALAGGRGDDALDGGSGQDEVSHPDAVGPVTVDLAAATVTGEGTDTLAGIEDAEGGPQDDLLIGDERANALDGRSGNDRLVGGLGADILTGGAGTDTVAYPDLPGPVTVDLDAGLAMGEGSDTLRAIEDAEGTPGDDSLTGDGEDNDLQGGEGQDVIVGGAGADTLGGGGGFDSLDGDSGADRMAGNEGDDAVRGAGGPDGLRGGPGADLVVGGPGNDVCRVSVTEDEVRGCER